METALQDGVSCWIWGGEDGNQDGVLGAYGIKDEEFVVRNRCCVCSYKDCP